VLFRFHDGQLNYLVDSAGSTASVDWTEATICYALNKGVPIYQPGTTSFNFTSSTTPGFAPRIAIGPIIGCLRSSSFTADSKTTLSSFLELEYPHSISGVLKCKVSPESALELVGSPY
jgi:hypothetical protein